MRIVKTRFKILFLASWVIVLGVVVGILPAVGLRAAGDWVSTLGFALMTIVAVRIFRVREEDIAAPRPRWRMTGRPTAGFFIGGINVLSAASGAWGLVYSNVVADPPSIATTLAGGGSLPIQIASLVIDAIFGVLFLRSSFRLARRVPAPSWAR
jgi:hypothetical protein